jgi:hypothetical protein
MSRFELGYILGCTLAAPTQSALIQNYLVLNRNPSSPPFTYPFFQFRSQQRFQIAQVSQPLLDGLFGQRRTLIRRCCDAVDRIGYWATIRVSQPIFCSVLFKPNREGLFWTPAVRQLRIPGYRFSCLYCRHKFKRLPFRREAGVPVTTNRVGSMFTWFFTRVPVTDFASASTSDAEAFGRFHRRMLEAGVWLPPSQCEAAFVSASHGPPEVDHILSSARSALTL